MSLRYKGGVISSVAPTTSGTSYTGVATGVWSMEDQIQAKAAGLWPKGAGVPGSPTITTVTGGNAEVIVAFTAPADTGGSAITGYTATSSPGGISASGASSPITVTGLTNGTAYTFTVVATNISGNSLPSAASSSVTPIAIPTIIGQAFAGGYYAGQISTAGNGVADYYLVVGPKSSAQSSTLLQWKTSNTDSPGTSSVINGPANSAAMNDTSHPAAYFCEGLTIGGYSDWYLPAANEIEVCYYNLKPTTDLNVTFVGANPNAVPARGSNYPSGGPPTQTSAADFRSTGTEFFNSLGNDYWNSTQATVLNGSLKGFAQGYAAGFGKANTFRVRAIRRVPV